jgi:NitT/TauT family transport system substrate-binding protein
MEYAMRKMALMLLAVVATLVVSLPAQSRAQSKLRIGWCSKTLNMALAPIAVARKKGWFKSNNVDFDLFTFAGSTDCMRNLAIGELTIALVSPEPIGILALQGVKAKIFFDSYRRNIFGMAVADDSGIKTYADLKGQSIGVLSMGSVGVIVARAVVSAAGLNPDRDVRIVVSGEPAQTAALMRRGDVKALSQFDTYYAMIERAGVKLRKLRDPEIERFPSNAWVALDDTLTKRRAEIVGFARAYAMGTAYTIRHPREAIEIVYELYPETKPQGVELEDGITSDLVSLGDRIKTWQLDNPEKDAWGTIDVEAFQSYFDWLQKWGLLRSHIDAKQVSTDDLIDEINRFDKNLVEQK